MTENAAQDLEDLLTFVRDARGFDFTGYKRSSLTRRIRKRMGDVGIEAFSDYRDLLEVDAQEFRRLFDTILINVTSFFRDPECWQFLRDEVVPDIVSHTGTSEPVRLWVAGCSSGEEAYSLAITFCEVLGPEQFRQRVKIYATDVDDDALRTARHGVYGSKSIEAVPEDYRSRYFEPVGNAFEFRTDLRRQVIFGRHDITRDAPISRLHLLSCRNTLMYFNAATQADILDRFHFALADEGYLLLGRAEMLLTGGDRFEAISMPNRLFRRRPVGPMTPDAPVIPAVTVTAAKPPLARSRQLRDLAIDATPMAHLIVDVDGIVVLINNQARAMFGLTFRDEGRLLRDLEISYRPVELRSLIEQAQTEHRVVRVNAVERSLGMHDTQYLDLLIQPLIAGDGMVLGVDVAFTDTTPYVTLQEEAKRASQDLETAYEELQSTNEELETTNEELQSTVEELETTNEELQSTNEELETTNEELQSTNEELETMNEELRIRTSELDESRRYLEGVLASVPTGMVVLDSGLQVQLWNAAAEEMWGLREEEVRDQPFFALDIGLPTGKLRQLVRDSLDGQPTQSVELEATNRRGRSMTCAIQCSPLGDDGQGIILTMAEKHDEWRPPDR